MHEYAERTDAFRFLSSHLQFSLSRPPQPRTERHLIAPTFDQRMLVQHTPPGHDSGSRLIVTPITNRPSPANSIPSDWPSVRYRSATSVALTPDTSRPHNVALLLAMETRVDCFCASTDRWLVLARYVVTARAPSVTRVLRRRAASVALRPEEKASQTCRNKEKCRAGFVGSFWGGSEWTGSQR